jgi:hypothetical protein
MPKPPKNPRAKPSSTKAVPATDPRTPSGQPSRFELPEPSKFDPEKIIRPKGDDPFAMFMLALAVVFNDHKGLFLLSDGIDSLKPPDGEISAHAGEWHGLNMQIYRLRIGMFRELFTLIETFLTEANGPQMQRILKRIPPGARVHWEDLVRVALDKGGVSDKKFKTILVKIRANLSFHYYQPKQLVAGYRRHFFESEVQPGNAHAYASLGKNMERTRFYFADAAIQGSLRCCKTVRDSNKDSCR